MPSSVPLHARLLATALLIFIGAAGHAADSVDALAQDVGRLDALRQAKDLQRTYVQLAQGGQWNAMGALFTRDAQFIRGSESVAGSAAIANWLTQHRGGGRQGLAPGALHFEMIDQPLANLSPDGQSVKVRWDGLLFAGDGKGGTRIEGGIYENEYQREGGVWKISVSRYFPQYDGDYDKGWRNTDNADLGIAPYHFTLDETGVPLPPAPTAAPKSKASLAELEARVAQFNDEDAVANLQHAYGYYVDRRMWDDVVDLFAQGRLGGHQGRRRLQGRERRAPRDGANGAGRHHRRSSQRPSDVRYDRPQSCRPVPRR